MKWWKLVYLSYHGRHEQDKCIEDSLQTHSNEHGSATQVCLIKQYNDNEMSLKHSFFVECITKMHFIICISA